MTFNPESISHLRALPELRGWLKETLHGRGRMVFLTGNNPTLRDRIATELAAAASQARMHVCHARCRDSDRPYQCWSTSMQALLVDDRLAADANAWDLGCNALRELRGAAIRIGRCERDAQEFFAFDSTALFLNHVVGQRPVLQVLHDLDDADLPSLRLLHFVARALHRAPLFILATYTGNMLAASECADYLNGELARESKRIIV